HRAPRPERSPAVARGVIRKAMSYILDALKKAEREHHQAKVPTLQTVHRTSWAPPRHLWQGIGAAVALVNVAVLIWLLVPGAGTRGSQGRARQAPGRRGSRSARSTAGARDTGGDDAGSADPARGGGA